MRSLVVDDEPMGRIMLARFLKEYGTCDQAANGEEAIELFEHALDNKEPYDLVCLDIIMPGMDGNQTLLAMRNLEQENGDRSRSIVFMISASRAQEDMSSAFLEGDCDDYVVKPPNRQDLLKLMEEYKLI